MKKAVYIILPALLLLHAAGCGMADANERVTSPSPVVSATPGMTTPDVGNGVVNDRDGVITPGDNGMTTTAAPTARPEKTKPGTSPSATPAM